jgi:hypothetical protein
MKMTAFWDIAPYSLPEGRENLKSHRLVDAIFLITAFKGNDCCPSILNSFSLRIPSMFIRDYSTFSVHCSFKVSPSAVVFCYDC